MNDILQYAGRRVVVTGAASGIGASAARILSELGAEVHGLDINVPADHPCRHFRRCDLADEASIDAAVEAIRGPVDSLLNCAGLSPVAPTQQVLLVNFVGARALTEKMIPHMRKGSSIGFVSSGSGMGWLTQMEILRDLVATEGFEAGRAWCQGKADLIGENGYGFSKEAINAYVVYRGFQLAPEGIRVNGIMPGPVQTPMYDHFLEVMGANFLDELPRPLGRNSTPDEQAWPLIALNSPVSSYVTGALLMTDGGFAAGIYTGGIDPSQMIR